MHSTRDKRKRADRSPPSREVRFSSPSEEQLQRKLNLPRGTEVAGRETRALNFPERSAGCGENGIAEVGMVEYVEHLAPELEREFLGQLRIFCDREVLVMYRKRASTEENEDGSTMLWRAFDTST